MDAVGAYRSRDGAGAHDDGAELEKLFELVSRFGVTGHARLDVPENERSRLWRSVVEGERGHAAGVRTQGECPTRIARIAAAAGKRARDIEQQGIVGQRKRD